MQSICTKSLRLTKTCNYFIDWKAIKIKLNRMRLLSMTKSGRRGKQAGIRSHFEIHHVTQHSQCSIQKLCKFWPSLHAVSHFNQSFRLSLPFDSCWLKLLDTEKQSFIIEIIIKPSEALIHNTFYRFIKKDKTILPYNIFIHSHSQGINFWSSFLLFKWHGVIIYSVQIIFVCFIMMMEVVGS